MTSKYETEYLGRGSFFRRDNNDAHLFEGRRVDSSPSLNTRLPGPIRRAIQLSALGFSGLAVALAINFCIEAQQNAENTSLANQFNDRTRTELNRTLSANQNYYPEVEVVPAGKTFIDLLQMKQAGDPVNVRPYPSGYFPNGKPVEPFGTLPQGTRITNVVTVAGTAVGSPNTGTYGAFDCTSPNRPIQDKKGNPVNVIGRICAIAIDYLKAVKK